MKTIHFTLAFVMLTLSACSSTGGASGSKASSQPINDSEAKEYDKAIVRCYKLGGSRIVKIMGTLRCY